MFKVYITTQYSHLQNKTIGFFEKKEDAEKFQEWLSKQKLYAFSRIKMSQDVFKKVCSVEKLVTKKDGDYIVSTVDKDTLDDILEIVRNCGKRSMNHFFFSSDYSIKKTISKNNLSKIDSDLAENIAKAIIYLDKKVVSKYEVAIKEIPLH